MQGNAFLRYNTLNQSEPLRINLYLLLMLTIFLYPAGSNAITGEFPTAIGTAALALGGTFGLYWFLREFGWRSDKIYRMEKELNTEFMAVHIPGGGGAIYRPPQQ